MASASLLLLASLAVSLTTFFLLHASRCAEIRTAASSQHAFPSTEMPESEKTSGDDNVDGGARIPTLDNFRVLLGMDTHSFQSSAPSPSPASVPYPPARHGRLHPPFPSAGLIPFLQTGKDSNTGNKWKAGRIAMTVVLSTVGAVLVVGLASVFLFWRSGRDRRTKLEKKKKKKTQCSVAVAYNGSRKANLPNLNVISKRNPLYHSSSSNGESIECSCNLEGGSSHCSTEVKPEICSSSRSFRHSEELKREAIPSPRQAFNFSKPPPPLPPLPPLPTLLVRAPPPPPSGSPPANPPPPLLSSPATRIDVNGTTLPPPPPPPPPPPQKGVPPPPPFLCSTMARTANEKQKFELKLKPLHWDKVRAGSNQPMVWNKMRATAFELDEESMESLFGCNSQASTKNEELLSSATKTGSAFNKLVLDPQRVRNFTILLKALSATTDQVCEAVSQGSGLSAQQLDVLSKMAPTKKEELKLLSYDGDMNVLDPAEKFLASVLRIPCSFPKIDLMLYAETFDEEVSQIRKSFTAIEEACGELQSSRVFLKLLQAVLKAGNRMNSGTKRGDAEAFRLDALLKLAGVKGTDGKTTLLHFILKEVTRSELPEKMEEDYRSAGVDLVTTLGSELSNVRKCAGFDFRTLSASISNLTDGMLKLRHLMTDRLPVEERSGCFATTMNDFHGKCERTVEELKGEERKVMQMVKETMVYFHGDVSNDEVEQLWIFVVVRDFICMLEQTCREIGSSKKRLSPNCAAKRAIL